MDYLTEDYFEVASSSVKLVQGIASTVQLNPCQCEYLSAKLGETGTYLKSKKDVLEKISRSDDIRRKALRHLYFAVKRAEMLVRGCCCEWEASWLESAVTLTVVKEEIVDILLELRWWTSLVDVAIASVTWASSGQEIELELLKCAENELQALLKELRSNPGNGLDEAAEKDKGVLVKKVREFLRTMGDNPWSDPQKKRDYLLAIHLQTRLENADLKQPVADVELNAYKPTKLIGQGSFGSVMDVKWLGRRCALKVLKFKCDDEATTLSAFQHPHIVQFLRYWEGPYVEKSKKPTFSTARASTPNNAMPNGEPFVTPDSTQSFILMELLPTDLEGHMQTGSKRDLGARDPKPVMTQDAAIDAMLQVAKAMWHMNEASVAHRDLKPSNVLARPVSEGEVAELAHRGYVRVKLGDFGLAKTKAASAYTEQTRMVGTKVYGAPEVFDKAVLSGKKFPRQADVWSFGIMLNECLTGKLPYSVATGVGGMNDLQPKIRRGVRPELPKNCPDYLKFCITSCWELHPKDRPEFADLWRLVRYAQVRSLGLIQQNHDLFTFRTKGGDTRTLHPTPAPPKDVKSRSFWLIFMPVFYLFSRRRDPTKLQSNSQSFNRQQSKAAGSSVAAVEDKPLGYLVNSVVPDESTADSVLDVIFFEGNVGRRKYLSCKDTWVQRGKPEVRWPRDWLLKDFKGDIRVLLLEYSISDSGINGVVDELLRLLVFSDRWNRGQTWNRPIVLVGHSLGCVVIEQLVVALSEKAKSIGSLDDEFDTSRAKVSEAFLASLAGCFFFAAPYTGLVPSEDLLKYVFGGLNYSSTLFADLCLDSSRLKGLSEQFMQALSKRVELMALIEGHHTKGRTVVPSASMQVFRERGGRVEDLKDSNHEGTCKPINKEHPAYQHLRDFIQRILSERKVAEDTSGDKQPVSMVTYLSQ